MREKIYYGDVDIIDTRTGEILTIKNVMYKANHKLSELCGRALSSIPRKDQQYYNVKRLHIDSAKVIGETI